MRASKLAVAVVGLSIGAPACSNGAPAAIFAAQPSPTGTSADDAELDKELLGPNPPQAPRLSAPVQNLTVRVGGMTRSYVAFVPKDLPKNAPLLLAFHGTGMNGELMRAYTGYEFDKLADSRKFVVVYPNGYGRHWNDCRTDATYPARTENVDDVGFVRAIIDKYRESNDIDPNRIFAMGYSNGGHMTYRLASATPGQIKAISAVAANFPGPGNNVCPAIRSPMPMLMITGTKDPLDPYNGGDVVVAGTSYGKVLSSPDTAAHFAELNGNTATPHDTKLPHQAASGSTSVSVRSYAEPGKPPVTQYTVDNGGHVVPNRVFEAPSQLGPTTHDLDAPPVIWDFFMKNSG
ncbi:dienelactone hydrolase family protein [Nonomuraea sp. NPDC048881]|uniref:alpha/beta hydrolase family esterase n=1 Tax=Nonomuraea sp. NPDC048881 TaxID=3155030 RepID=UPI00340955A0